MKALKFTIDRSRWARGRMNADGHADESKPLTNLLNTEGEMCCLGFYALACGLKPGAILNRGDYTDSSLALDELPIELAYNETDLEDGERRRVTTRLHDDLVAANDSRNLDDRRREARIADLFAKMGVKVDFVDKVDSCEKCGAEQGLAHLPSCPEYPAYLKDV